jgi:hypothetical protein
VLNLDLKKTPLNLYSHQTMKTVEILKMCLKLRSYYKNFVSKSDLVNHYPRFNLVLFILFILLTNSCSINSTRPPIPTGHIPPASPVSAEDERYGHELLAELSQKYKLDYNHPRRASVDTIAQKLTSSIGGANLPWHVNVFADSTVKNAAATKGNHIFVWTGMIDATNNDDELAGILAHEIGHILARHTETTNDEQVREFLVTLGSFAAGAAASILTNGTGTNIAGQLASSLTKEVGSGLLIYPYSRAKENEADELGLFLMKRAGFNPQAAIDFWTRALNDPAFSSSISFLSTHPPAADRLQNLKAILPLVNNNYSPQNIPQIQKNLPPAPVPNSNPIATPDFAIKTLPTNTPQPNTSYPTAIPSPSILNNGKLSDSDSFDIRNQSN